MAVAARGHAGVGSPRRGSGAAPLGAPVASRPRRPRRPRRPPCPSWWTSSPLPLPLRRRSGRWPVPWVCRRGRPGVAADSRWYAGAPPRAWLSAAGARRLPAPPVDAVVESRRGRSAEDEGGSGEFGLAEQDRTQPAQVPGGAERLLERLLAPEIPRNAAPTPRSAAARGVSSRRTPRRRASTGRPTPPGDPSGRALSGSSVRSGVAAGSEKARTTTVPGPMPGEASGLGSATLRPLVASQYRAVWSGPLQHHQVPALRVPGRRGPQRRGRSVWSTARSSRVRREKFLVMCRRRTASANSMARDATAATGFPTWRRVTSVRGHEPAPRLLPTDPPRRCAGPVPPPPGWPRVRPHRRRRPRPRPPRRPRPAGAQHRAAAGRACPTRTPPAGTDEAARDREHRPGDDGEPLLRQPARACSAAGATG